MDAEKIKKCSFAIADLVTEHQLTYEEALWSLGTVAESLLKVAQGKGESTNGN